MINFEMETFTCSTSPAVDGLNLGGWDRDSGWEHKYSSDILDGVAPKTVHVADGVCHGHSCL